MHGVNLSILKALQELSASSATAAHVTFDAEADVLRGRSTGFRNIFGLQSVDQMFTANDRMPTPFEAPGSVRVLMRRLARAMNTSPRWIDTLPGAGDPSENPGLPSGYTYLLQLIAHDLVDSTVSLASTDGARFGFTNARRIPLALETIYGGGPHVCPRAYEISLQHHGRPGLVPRTRLRLGRLRRPAGGIDGTAGCPFRDLARGRLVDTTDSAVVAPGLEGDDGSSGQPFPVTETLAADARNDDHAIISQMTVRRICEAQHALYAGLPKPPEEDNLAYLRFACAQTAVVLVYRRIVVNDVLRRILHPEIFAWYERQGFQPTDTRAGVPLEFTHGAFRFGHAMVRQTYRINSDTPLQMGRALEQSSQRQPTFLPVSTDWHIDWTRFFLVSQQEPNLSSRIGPRYVTVLGDEMLFPGLDEDTDIPGLACRDLVSACYAGMWSVPMLFGELRRGPLKHLVPDFAEWHAPIKAWLDESTKNAAEKLDDDDIGDLIADPPMPFFILLEAAFSNDAIAPSSTSEGGGRHLGPVGSIIVAETILGAIRDHRISFEDAGPDLAARMRKAADRLIGGAPVLEPLARIQTMPDLIGFLNSSGILTAGDPG